MSDMIRRKKAVPVQARRVEPSDQIFPSTVKVPGASTAQPSPGVTQNIIYVNMPAVQPTPPPPVEQAEIHVHTHVHQYPVRRQPRRNQTSFLGTLGFVLGGVACGTSYVPQLVWLSRPIAVLALGCAAVALIGAMISSRIGRGMPLLGIISSTLAYGIWMVRSGQMQMPALISDNLAKITSPAPVNGSAPSSSTDSAKPENAPTPPPAAPAPKDHSIFGDGGNWGNSPSKAPDAAPSTTPQVVPLPPSAPASPSVLDLDTAKANLETARVNAAKKIGVDYLAVKSAATEARNDCEQTRASSTPGSAEVQSAWRRYMNAASDLADLQKKLDSDPTVAAAQAAIRNAKP